MNNDLYKGTRSGIYTITVVISSFLVLGYLENGLNIHLFYGAISGLLVMLWVLYAEITTYLEIRDKRTLLNKGQKSFGHDEIDIYDIKYVYRIPQFIIRGWGSIMLIVVQQGEEIKYSSVREANYNDVTIKAFLARLTQLNPSIELEQQYQDLIDGKLGGENQPKFTKLPAAASVDEVEKRLRDKGKHWERRSIVGMFMDKFR